MLFSSQTLCIWCHGKYRSFSFTLKHAFAGSKTVRSDAAIATPALLNLVRTYLVILNSTVNIDGYQRTIFILSRGNVISFIIFLTLKVRACFQLHIVTQLTLNRKLQFFCQLINKAQTTYIPIIPIIPIIPKSESEYGKNSQKMSEEFEHSRVAWAEEVTKLLGRREAFAKRS